VVSQAGHSPLISPADTSRRTLAHYDATAAEFRDRTRDHDVTENVAAFVDAIEGPPPRTILDFGCGPGRDLLTFRDRGHVAVGLDGAPAFVAMARAGTGCEVLQQDFLALDLPAARFDGVFANASLFHVPSRDLPRVLRELHRALKPRGVLFVSNPRGSNREGWQGDRYACGTISPAGGATAQPQASWSSRGIMITVDHRGSG
jgi:SAM-dependent methyltransferase